ncbi:hypothetical protein SKAU_G00291670, partial [Synaphobranchus kaupii]
AIVVGTKSSIHRGTPGPGLRTTDLVESLPRRVEAVSSKREWDTASPTRPGLRLALPITERTEAASTRTLPRSSRFTASHLHAGSAHCYTNTYAQHLHLHGTSRAERSEDFPLPTCPTTATSEPRGTRTLTLQHRSRCCFSTHTVRTSICDYSKPFLMKAVSRIKAWNSHATGCRKWRRSLTRKKKQRAISMGATHTALKYTTKSISFCVSADTRFTTSPTVHAWRAALVSTNDWRRGRGYQR